MSAKRAIVRALLGAFVTAVFCAVAHAQEGEVFASERDTSLDGRQVAFVRLVPGRMLAAPSGDSLPVSELCVSALDGSGARVLLVAGAKRHRNGSPIAGFWSPQFSPDGARVWFTSPATVTSDVACAVDVRTGAVREACGANSLRVVKRGARAGCLIVEQHRYRKGGGSYDWLYLVDPAGRTLATLGDPEAPKVKAKVAALLAGR
ncbi:MAG: hypothetical protein HZA61_02115 [Candidatus Eisenbacteria bacterium]|uniref:Uncharacterized protein n=1 Tax=Eiseniibacteriota bacterium TaxID=2212470 RepID=A0A933S9Z0_UNCEI|nr:hypothetical protein [Candidatus Eisenbacteria bacterium]